jgi:outer membrane lipoprotein-sorting protein
MPNLHSPLEREAAVVRRRIDALARLACAALLVAGAAQASAADTPLTLDRLMTELARNGPGTVRFTEVKSSALLKAPIESSGTLSYAAPARLEKHTRRPRDERLVVDRDTVVIESAARGERLELRLADYPAVRASIESIRGTLAGDLAALQRYYRVQLEGAWTDWRLHLLPSTPELAELVHKVLIGGRGARVQRIEILEASGDRSVMTISKDGA